MDAYRHCTGRGAHTQHNGGNSVNRVGRAVVVAVLFFSVVACGRSDKPAATTPPSASNATPAASRLDSGGFGDMANVCKATDTNGQKAGGATARGVTDTEIHIGTVTDKGNTVKNGLDKEMYDTAAAFVAWCNAHGGILGRKIVLDDLDAKLFNYNDVITKGCSDDFALVGGGAVFDGDDHGQRVQCGLPSIAGYVVTNAARRSDLLVQPVPNPLDKLPVGAYRAIESLVPGGLQHYGSITGNVETTQLVQKQTEEAIGLIGGTVVSRAEYNVVSGESNWAPFVDDLKSRGVKVFELIGEYTNLVDLQKAMATAQYFPDVTIENTNFYDSLYAQEGAANAKNTYIRSIYFPLEMKDQNPATADYLSLMQQFNPSGKIANLGMQGLSAWLLFAQAANACGSQLTAQCLLDKAKVSNWTAGGLHAATDPASGAPSSCFLLLKLDGSNFVYDNKDTQPNQGVFNCGPNNVVTLTTSVPPG